MVYWIPEQLDIVFQLVVVILYMNLAFLALVGFMAIIVAVILISPARGSNDISDDEVKQNIQKGGEHYDNDRHGVSQTSGKSKT